ncbi:DNA-binding anti-repressor SinI [Sediminibacillus dalangtanensis]|uniref:DNA-binding anti-repressor SinI n=1 Tax=Sediminibacillus dalangtanensis TaxID=2729421 RepID=A0ABX7VQQ6_9BACI|nr:anti-repressor SinI family protein [Sediminibacillus dalangtanensis]QTM98304.1 DNA-binding anti-repressor SinI [Sediminibacillus dalangtanensis]
MRKKNEQDVLDQEWMQLIINAKGLGMTPEEVRSFLHTNSRIKERTTKK